MFVIRKKSAVIIIAVGLIVLFIFFVVLFKAVPSTEQLNFSAEFYYVCYDSPSDSTSASSISSLVHGYGGAGYVVEKNGKYYVTVSCYYSEREAQTVCNNLKEKGLSCSVITAKGQNYKIKSSDGKFAKQYESNLQTMFSVSKICYDLANSIDKYETNQSGAKAVLSNVKKSLDGLLSLNKNNCFSKELNNLIAECEDVSYGYIFAYDVRRLQIAVCDSIVNIKLY
ncbi:MAG: hypothetical protein ACI4MS_05455 [Candidatus Coproplasma sp.]